MTISLDGMIFGMPPGTHVSDAMMMNSMPQATITPCEPKFSEGLSLFKLDQENGKKKYDNILNSVGYSISSKSIRVAYLADNFPTDTFNNEYGETFLDRFAQATSSGLGDLAQIAGWTNFSTAESQAKNFVEALPFGGVATGAYDTFKGMINNAGDKMNTENHKMFNNMQKTMQSLVTGARVDFPSVWKNSSFTPSYGMTIRLYNPNPGNATDTKKYIIGPLAAILALGVPFASEDSATFKWPLICRIRSEGIYHLNAGYINSISVIKGGDQQNIAYNQVLGMVDVRIDFGSLYNSILAGKGTDLLGEDRPTLGSYLEAIGGKSVTSASSSKTLMELDNSVGQTTSSTTTRGITSNQTAVQSNRSTGIEDLDSLLANNNFVNY